MVSDGLFMSVLSEAFSSRCCFTAPCVEKFLLRLKLFPLVPLLLKSFLAGLGGDLVIHHQHNDDVDNMLFNNIINNDNKISNNICNNIIYQTNYITSLVIINNISNNIDNNLDDDDHS